MPLQQTSGAASYDAFGGGVPFTPTYIEDVMSTFLYSGTNATQTINNGIDLSGKGGLVWLKPRNWATSHMLFDTNRGTGKILYSDATAAQSTDNNSLTAFNSNGFTLGTSNQGNASPYNFVGWTFRKAPKFFDVVTYTGDGTSNRPVAHSLASVPGCIIIKSTSTVTNWMVWHRSLPTDNLLTLNSTAAQANYATVTIHDVTSTNFQVDNYSMLNASGVQYVAYVFAHNAGGFGLTGTDNVISCGSFTTSTVSDTITLGYEPQWVLAKAANSATNWYIFDNMRGIPTGGLDLGLKPNSSAAESADANFMDLTATGFTSNFQAIFGDGINIIYIAIRRGPMKVPTDGTKVYTNAIQTTGTTPTTSTTGFPVDLIIQSQSPSATNKFWSDRLRGSTTNSYNYVLSNATSAEATGAGGGIGFDNNTGFANNLLSPNPLYDWCFRRAPGFFDEVCYTGTGVARTVAHNLAAVPELMIVKSRSSTGNWPTYNQASGAGQVMNLNSTAVSSSSSSMWNSTTPTSSVFSVGNNTGTNGSETTYVAYLFATCPGVSKVGGYTGDGSTQTINCGFTGGARFVLIKCTSITGGWYVYDTARGMTTSTDPYLFLNSTSAETATLGSVTTVTTGFAVDAAILYELNQPGETYIFLAIA